MGGANEGTQAVGQVRRSGKVAESPVAINKQLVMMEVRLGARRAKVA